jgi:hypothetical protein
MWLAESNGALQYAEIVKNSLDNNEVFNNFKNNQNYYNIVGMSEKWQSDIWYENIKNNYPNFYNNLEVYSKNDLHCNPNGVSEYDTYKLTPNTLRYINTCCEIYDYFNFKDESINISELGIGYGGLCYMMNKTFNISEYSLLDLPNVCELSKKYLELLDIKNITLEFNSPDLFISEFCLSEFDDDEMYEFYDKYVTKSKNIYLHMNLHDDVRKSKFLNKLSDDFEYTVSEEFPKTHWPNYVIKGKNKNLL